MLTQIEQEKLEPDFHTKANLCAYQTLRMVDLIQILAKHQWQVTKSLHAHKKPSPNTQPQHTTQPPKNKDTMISPTCRLPAALNVKVSAIAVRFVA
jgi:hypothetical protein